MAVLEKIESLLSNKMFLVIEFETFFPMENEILSNYTKKIGYMYN